MLGSQVKTILLSLGSSPALPRSHALAVPSPMYTRSHERETPPNHSQNEEVQGIQLHFDSTAKRREVRPMNYHPACEPSPSRYLTRPSTASPLPGEKARRKINILQTRAQDLCSPMVRVRGKPRKVRGCARA